MADLFISGINQRLLDKFTNRLNKLRAGGAKKGDKSKYTIQAIEQWLDTIPKDRGHLLLQKEIDELKAENLRLNSAENPAYRQLVKEYREMEQCLKNYERSTALPVKPEDTQEVFEILCSIPFDVTAIHDGEPSHTRHPAIEAMIQQLKEIINKEE